MVKFQAPEVEIPGQRFLRSLEVPIFSVTAIAILRYLQE